MSDDPKEPMSILDVKAVLEDVFKGCTVTSPNAMMGSYHAEVRFDEYEVRVIMTGSRLSPKREMHFRFLQRIVPFGQKREQKVLISEVHTKDEEELVRAIRGCKEYLLGVIQSIDRALRHKPVSQVRGVEDLLR